MSKDFIKKIYFIMNGQRTKKNKQREKKNN